MLGGEDEDETTSVDSGPLEGEDEVPSEDESAGLTELRGKKGFNVGLSASIMDVKVEEVFRPELEVEPLLGPAT